ncbi:MAG: CDP-alcohol phosphatidyltransferase family protein [Phycisphaerae bacterium]|nr:CDP-alcohol phosphatidyltransferase family protein [Phycisphaerae bacterium]MDD5380204.1 CDP-alcohol phosphatidyltransferase family protein [Phycisphaerae bacterium]
MIKHLPNILTFGRLVLTVIFLVMLLMSPRYYTDGERPFPDFLDYAFIIFVIAGLTDVIDGPIARKLNVASKFGRMLDPLIDKVLVCGAFICFVIIGEPKLFGFAPAAMAAIQWSITGVIILREVYVTALRHIAEARGINFAATASGKIKMFLQSFAIGTVVIKIAHVQTATWGYWFTTITFAITLIVTIVSGLRATQRSAWKKVSG